MFQSSSTASGSWRLHTSRAFSPSSASMIWKSRPSRIRRATLRMTLESSTTRQVLMLSPYVSSLSGHLIPYEKLCCGLLCRHHVRCDLQHAIDIEDDHELAVEPVDAAGELGHAGVEVDGVFLAAGLGQAQHLADGVDQEAIGFAAQVDADSHRGFAVVVF